MQAIRLLIFLLLLSITKHTYNRKLVRGVNIVGPFNDTLNLQTINSMKELNANWVAFLPEASISRATLNITRKQKDQTWSHSDLGYKKFINDCKRNGLKVLLKPHMVVEKKRGLEDRISNASSWRGDIELNNKKDWITLEEEYASFIIKYAKLAEDTKVDLFVLGTELKSFVKERPAFWIALIAKVRIYYKGPISYSANWDNYNNIPFWPLLDLISINGYFPVSDDPEPQIKKVISEWKKITSQLDDIASNYKKKILITEFGYRNRYSAGTEPWLHVSETPHAIKNDQAQQNLYEAFFDSIWKSDNVIGGLVWNWNQVHQKKDNTDFSIQEKPIHKLISSAYQYQSEHQ